jgi:hypothetical protein
MALIILDLIMALSIVDLIMNQKAVDVNSPLQIFSKPLCPIIPTPTLRS